MIATTDFEILPELRDCLPASTADEKKRLKEGIERDGMLYGILLCTIKGMPGRYILDGHTRYQIAIELDMPPAIHADDILNFDSVDDAVCWIIEHQAARRNLDEEQQTIIWGRYYELRKKPHGTNQFTNDRSGQNDHSSTTAQQVANELGISEKTVRRAAAKTKKIDALGLTSAVMDGTVKKIEAAALDELAEAVEEEPERKEEIVEEFIGKAKQNNGRAKATKKPKPEPETHEQTVSDPDEIDPELEEAFAMLCERTTNTIYRVRTEWPESYLRRLRKVVDGAFLCEIPLEWMEA